MDHCRDDICDPKYGPGISDRRLLGSVLPNPALHVAMTVYVLYYYAPHLGETDEPPSVSQWQLSASEQIRFSASRSIGESEQRYYSKCLWSESVSR